MLLMTGYFIKIIYDTSSGDLELIKTLYFIHLIDIFPQNRTPIPIKPMIWPITFWNGL
jgi:hypothetical protein